MKKKITIGILFGLLLAFAVIPFFNWANPINLNKNPNDAVDQNHTFDPIVTIGNDANYISYTAFRETIAHAGASTSDIDLELASRKIRIDTAEDLYRFSMDVSFHPYYIYPSNNPAENVKLTYPVIQKLLDLDYVLGNDIDYAIMGAKRFIPIGFQLVYEDVFYDFPFSGTFNGRGFEISNLYVGGIDFMTIPEGDVGSEIDVATSTYYAMFTHNTGAITNLGLITPQFEMLSDQEDINKAANLVGYNGGLVDKVYVIDLRNAVGSGGMKMFAPIGSAYTAAGIVYENALGATFTNAYFAGRVVVNTTSLQHFTVQPVIFLNNGSISNLVYDQSIYQTNYTLNGSPYTVATPTNVVAKTTTQLKNDSSTSALGLGWFYYPLDRYPSLFGLTLLSSNYQLSNAVELVQFSKLLSFSSISFRTSNFEVTQTINMDQVAPFAYKTPTVPFTGNIIGKGGPQQIANLTISSGSVFDNQYFIGFLARSTGLISNLIFSSAAIEITNSEANYGAISHIGIVAGQKAAGNTTQVMVNGQINLGTTTLGESNVGIAFGSATGTISGLYGEGLIEGNTHTFNQTLQVNPVYRMGGLIGTNVMTSNLSLTNALSRVTLNGIGTTNNINALSSPSLRLGGVVGNLNVVSTSRPTLNNITFEGNIALKTIQSVNPVNQNVAGIIGFSEGNSTYTNLLTTLVNNGNMNLNNTGSNQVFAAGGVVASHTVQTEFKNLRNYKGFTRSSSNNFIYTTLLLVVNNQRHDLRDSINYAHINWFGNSSFSGVFEATGTGGGLIQYVENRGNITIDNQSANQEIKIAGISTASNIWIDYVTVYSEIRVSNFTTNSPLYIAGILTTVNASRRLHYSTNQGKITVANVTTDANIYIGGITNILMAQINYNVNAAEITTTHNASTYGIYGKGNTFVGGIATFAANQIFFNTNLANITVSNQSAADFSGYSLSTAINNMDTFSVYQSAVIIGGVLAAPLNSSALLYNTTNDGNVIAISRHLTRAGGIVGITTLTELTAGIIGLNNSTFGVTVNNTIPTSFVHSAINYGNVAALSERIHLYSTVPVNFASNLNIDAQDTATANTQISITTTEGTGERPPVYASAGGILGYGNTSIFRATNHGQISSTDVSGGIIGTSSLISAANAARLGHITNYGDIRGVNRSNFEDLLIHDLSYTDIQNKFYDYNDPFIVPVSNNDLRIFPEHKRGIGGIIGRLQINTTQNINSQTNQNSGFEMIFNMNEHADFFGRVDQDINFSVSMKQIKFHPHYGFSAKYNDLTSAQYATFTYFRNGANQVTYTVDISEKMRYKYTFEGGIWYQESEMLREQKTEIYLEGNAHTRKGANGNTGSVVNTALGFTKYLKSETIHSAVWVVVPSSKIAVKSKPYPAYSKTMYVDRVTHSSATNSTVFLETFQLAGGTKVPYASEYQAETKATFVYDQNHPMHTNEGGALSYTLRTNTIIRPAPYEALNPRHQSTRLNGMFALASRNTNLDNGSFLFDEMLVSSIPNTAPIESQIFNQNQLRYYFQNEVRFTPQTLNFTDNRLSLNQNNVPIQIIDDRPSFVIEMNQNYYTSSPTVEFRVLSGNVHRFTQVAAPYSERIGSYATPEAYRLALLSAYSRTNAGQFLSNTNGARWTITLADYELITEVTRVKLGEIAVYSELAIKDPDMFQDENSVTYYPLYIDIKPLGFVDSPKAATYEINNLATSYSIDDTIHSNFTIPETVTGSLRINFVDELKEIPVGASVNTGQLSLWYNNEGTLVTVPWGTTSNTGTRATSVVVEDGMGKRTFNFNIVFGALLKTGEYQLRYRYHNNDIWRYVTFNYQAQNLSSNKVPTVLISHPAQYDQTISGTTITTYVPFNSIINVPGTINMATIETINEPTQVYFFGSTYTYNVSTIDYLSSITVSAYARLLSISYISTTYTGINKTYTFQYVVQAEDLTEATYTHFIIERPLELTNVYKDNNNILDFYNNTLFVTREASLTKFSFVFDVGTVSPITPFYVFGETHPDAYLSVSVSGLDYENQIIQESEIVGVSYALDNALNIFITSETKPGYYTFNISYTRDNIVSEFVIPIQKRGGREAYLTDIKFTDNLDESVYPQISIIDEFGVKKTQYNPQAFILGIDYDGAKPTEKHIRIDGTVANTPLDYYRPFFLDYLPLGATVARRVFNQGDDWTPEVGRDASPSEIAYLYADFTVIQETGLEAGDNESIIVIYRVTSEEQNDVVYYYITVTDAVFNASLIFNVYYRDALGNVSLAKDSILNNIPILITVANFNTNILVGNTPILNVDLFPVFTNITGYNNTVNQFFLGIDDNYRNRFGRNMSGFYQFIVDLKNPSSTVKYAYEIVFDGQPLNPMSDYISASEGVYFYINGSTRNRTRRFNIYIYDETLIFDDWGLVDIHDSFKE